MAMRLLQTSLASLLVMMVGCGSTLPPKELVDARKAYQKSQGGDAAQQTPAELDDAKKALDAAERSFSEEGDAPQTKDLAYVAERKSALADAAARLALAKKAREAAEREAQNLQVDELHRARTDLASTKDQLAREKSAREEAERKAAQARADLQKIASVKQESRGMVITLSGSVLFQTNKAALLPAAVAKLHDVGEALIKGNPDANITIEGHSDSQGQRQYNMDLSLERANAVKAQLVSHGVAADRITTVGVGPDRPIADNKTAEGRANNRRVEIIVQPSGK